MGEKDGMGEKGEMANMPPQLAKFHDTLAPRWHATHGPQRMADTCGAMAQFHADAGAIATSQAPLNGQSSLPYPQTVGWSESAACSMDNSC